jgi:hypothetical protein
LSGILREKTCVANDEQKVKKSSCYWGGTMKRKNNYCWGGTTRRSSYYY